MSKMDDLRNSVGSNVDESMGGGRSVRSPIPGVSPPVPRAVPPKLQGVTRINNAAEIALDKIGRDDSQPREEFDDDALDRLADSLKQRGQLQPIRVRWSEERGQYVIICGERRWRAAERAGLATMACIIVDQPLAADELLALQCVENLLREDLTDMEQARAFRSLMETNGWSTHQIARELGIVQPSVVRALALLKLPEAVQDQVEQGAINASTAYQLARIEDPVTLAETAGRAAAEGWSRDQTAEKVREIAEGQATSKARPAKSEKGRGASKGRPKLDDTYKLKAGGGKYSIIVASKNHKGFDRATLFDLLKEAMEQVGATLEQAEQGGETAAA